MKKERAAVKRERRDFLKLAVLGAATGGVALATGGGKAKAAASSKDDPTRYRETSHVKTYYDLARF